jgi:hypothetical protein
MGNTIQTKITLVQKKSAKVQVDSGKTPHVQRLLYRFPKNLNFVHISFVESIVMVAKQLLISSWFRYVTTLFQ